MKNYSITIIGGGPAGIMAAIRAAQILKDHNTFRSKNNPEVILIEKNKDLGKKLLITGGGRCNITQNSNINTIISRFGKNSAFLKPSFFNMDNHKLLEFFQIKGLDFKVEKQDKVYPVSDKASSVLDILKEYLKEYNVKLMLDTTVTDIQKHGKDFTIHIKTIPTKESENHSTSPNSAPKNSSKKAKIIGKRVILTTGGITYPSTGSSGEGMNIARNLGHTITPLQAGLVPFKVEDNWIKNLSGLKLENIGLSYKIKNENGSKKSSKKKITINGDVLFTHFGLSGPAILDFSRELSLIGKIGRESFPLDISLDLMIKMSPEELKDHFNQDLSVKGKKIIKNYLKDILPNNMIEPFLELCNVDPQKKMSQISRKEKNKILNNLKNLKVQLNGPLSIEKAMITCGGISHKEITPKTNQSKLIDGLFFAGEIIDFCGPTGGYNLQMAFSTGYTAGEWAAQSLIIKK